MKPTSLILSLSLLLTLSCKKNEQEISDTSSTSVNTTAGNKASIGDTLTIAGENFPTAPGSLQVYFNDQKAVIVGQDSKKVQFVVPVLKSFTSNVYLKDSKGTVIKQQEFQLDSVKITSIIAKVKSGEQLTIYGKNFQVLENLKVAVNNKVVNDVQVNSTGITFTMPDTIYPGRKPSIDVTANPPASGTSRFSASTTVSDKWVRVAYSPFVFRGLFAAFVYKDEGYLLSYDKEGTDKKALFYKLNPNTYKYTTYEVPLSTTDAVATTDNIYIIQNKTDIYKYGLADSTGTAFVTQVPNAAEKNNLFIAVNKDIYAFTGYSGYIGSLPVRGFYKYDVAAKNWVQRANFPEQTIPGVKLTSDGNKLYAVSDYQRFYVYDPDANTWERKSFTINPSRYYVTAFYAQHGKVYALITPGTSGETIYEYDPASDKWTSLGKLRNEFSSNFYGFFIGNKHFVGGHKHDSWSTELFESDASYLY